MKNWFVTGISRGFGLAIAKAALERGDNVVGTVRSHSPELPPLRGKLTTIRLDMLDEARQIAAVHEAFAAAGRIDVIVNNAGMGFLGAFEAMSDTDLKHLFEVDVFAPIRMTRTALPYLRRQASGHIINITSIAGRAPGVGAALYAAAKHALEGFSASLSQEVAPFGIQVTAVAPGQFRTNFLSTIQNLKTAGNSESYSPILDTALENLLRTNHQQPGDPDLAARAIVDMAYADKPPLHLLLGSDALARARAKAQAVQDEMQAWEATTTSTDFKDRHS